MSDPKKQKSKFYCFFVYHLPVIVYASLIILISSISNLKTPHIRYLAFDKVAHFCEYAVFAFLAVRSFQHISEKISKRTAFLLCSLFIIIFAVFDEYFVQSLSRRDSSVYDLLADSIGAHLVLLLVWLIQKRNQKRLHSEHAESAKTL